MCAVIIEDFKGLIIFITLRSRVQISVSLQEQTPNIQTIGGFLMEFFKIFILWSKEME